jgi:hypothetical protein
LLPVIERCAGDQMPALPRQSGESAPTTEVFETITYVRGSVSFARLGGRARLGELTRHGSVRRS